MSKKSFFIILVLSMVVTYGVSVTEMFLGTSVLYGSFGFPFNFSHSSFFGGGNTNYPFLFLDIIFWFIIIWVIGKGLVRLKR